MEAELEVALSIALDVVQHDQHVRLHVEQVADKALEAELLGVGVGYIAHDVIELWRRFSPRDAGAGVLREARSPAEPLLTFPELAETVHQQRVVLARPLGPVAVIANQPLALAEDHEVPGIGVDVPAAGVIGKRLHRLMADEGTALEDDQ